MLHFPGDKLVEGTFPQLTGLLPQESRPSGQPEIRLEGRAGTRRATLKALCALPALACSSAVIADEFAPAAGFWQIPRTIWARRPESGDEIRATYWADGALVQEGYIQLCHFMRDLRMERLIATQQRKGLAVPKDWYHTAFVDIALLDILYAFNGWLRHHNLDRPLVFNSAFRHMVSNGRTEGAALNSWHIKAGAGDIVVPDVSNESVTRFGMWLSAGGVGYYPNKHFTHVDRGRVRVFRGA